MLLHPTMTREVIKVMSRGKGLELVSIPSLSNQPTSDKSPSAGDSRPSMRSRTLACVITRFRRMWAWDLHHLLPITLTNNPRCEGLPKPQVLPPKTRDRPGTMGLFLWHGLLQRTRVAVMEFRHPG